MKYLLTALIVLSAPAVFAQQGDKWGALSHFADSVLQQQVDSNLIPGAVIEIKKDGVTIMKKAYGYAQKYTYYNKLIDNPEKMTTDHLFDIASLTKVVGTTTAIMLLVDEHKIGIDDAAGKYIAAFNSADKKGTTIRHLLTHTAGLYDWYPMYYRAHTQQETYALIGLLPLKYAVGKERHYSDLGFTILGEIIEKVSGQRLDSFVMQHVFSPLGMEHTAYNPLNSGKFKKITATSHGNPYEKRMVYDSTLGFVFNEIKPTAWDGWRKYTLRGEVNDGNAWYANGGISGAAGIFSTVDDLQKLTDMLLSNGKTSSRQFISGQTVKAFLTKDSFNNGLGWMMDPGNPVIKNGTPGSFGHTGFTGTSIAVIPQYHVSVILLINRQNIGLLPSNEYYNVGPIRTAIFKAVAAACE